MTMRPWPPARGSARGRISLLRISGKFAVEMFLNPAVIAILVFIAALFVLNVIEFGRLD